MNFDSLVQKNVSLRPLNWWKVGGQAEYFSAPVDLDQLKEVYSWAQQKKLKIHIFSGGSNILVKEGLIQGLVLSLHHLKGVVNQQISNDKFEVSAWAGTPKSDVARLFLQKKLMPAVFLTGIPGDLGGGVVMNAGVGEMITPREFCEVVTAVDVLRPDLTIERLQSEQIHWEYRHTSGWQPGIITQVHMSWPVTAQPEVLQLVRLATQKRVQSQPLDLPSGGSTFRNPPRNPPDNKAARLIDECGLKGLRQGGASVSLKHANFIVNDQNATADDIFQLIQKVQKTVEEKKGISLQTEVILFGGWDLNSLKT